MRHPIQKLCIHNGSRRLYTASRGVVQSFDLDRGTLLHTWVLSKEDFEQTDTQEKPETKNPRPSQATFITAKTAIRILQVSGDGLVLIACTDDGKAVIIFDANSLTVVKIVLLPKRPSCLQIDDERNLAIVGDKFGDVYTLPLRLAGEEEEGKVYDFLHKEPILGHVSMLTDLLLIRDPETQKQRIISCDRDEHIRVSRYPQAFVIETFCFGHLSYVSSVVVPEQTPEIIISGGGDPFLLISNWKSGEALNKVQLDPREFGSETGNVNVAKILYNPGDSTIYVIFDKSCRLGVFTYDANDQTLLFKSIYNASAPIIDAIIWGHDGLLLSLDSQDHMLEIYGSKQDSNNVALTEIESHISFECVSKQDIIDLFTVSQLRKHESERMN